MRRKTENKALKKTAPDLQAFGWFHQGQLLDVLKQKDQGFLEPIRLERKNHKGKHALLLLHGFAATPAAYRSFLPALSAYDLVFCPVLKGHCQSIEALAAAKASDWLAEVEQHFQALQESFEMVDVMGLSLGGLLACHLSKNFSIRHLYLLAPALDLHLNLGLYLPLVKLLKTLQFSELRSLSGDFYSEKAADLTYRKLPLSILEEILTLIQNFSCLAPKCPTDLFLGRYDKVVHSERVAARFKAQAGLKIHWLERSAHILPLDGDQAEILATVQEHFPR